MNNKIPPPVIGLTCAFIMWVIAFFTPTVTLPITFKYFIVTILSALGLFFDFTALYYFRRAKTTINPLTPNKASVLVTEGIYRFSRNPMYIGLLLLLLSWAFFLQSILNLLILFLFTSLITHFQIKPEEAALEQAFGEKYINYKNSVRRWL